VTLLDSIRELPAVRSRMMRAEGTMPTRTAPAARHSRTATARQEVGVLRSPVMHISSSTLKSKTQSTGAPMFHPSMLIAAPPREMLITALATGSIPIGPTETGIHVSKRSEPRSVKPSRYLASR
jgi:hypothetical protein